MKNMLLPIFVIALILAYITPAMLALVKYIIKVGAQ